VEIMALNCRPIELQAVTKIILQCHLANLLYSTNLTRLKMLFISLMLKISAIFTTSTILAISTSKNNAFTSNSQ
jgi:hypothetical protein